MFESMVGGAAEPVNCPPLPIRIRDTAPVIPEKIERIRRSRRNRHQHFPPGLFADPAWDLLLYLYSSDLCSKRTTVSKAVAAADVPETTGHRWLSHLLQLGLCERRPDPVDARRQYVSLTTRGRECMDGYFRAQVGFERKEEGGRNT
ncbi:MarR family winged helix-turn-helix transcriptional regulator [Sphingomonas kaistensis]|uniref:MarR family winged helix-turn-helix transcriptional regulator n=1 Tax=Sphingomonas kaistensis TaxID=298708 RepID=A0ABZ2G467_9SPHN